MTTLRIGKPLTNVRAEKTSTPQVIVRCTEGQISLTSSAAEALGFEEGDYLFIFRPEVDGPVYFTKGNPDNDEYKGGKLRGKAGKPLTMSSNNAWLNMGGSKEQHTVYSIAGVTPNVEGEAFSVDLGSGDQPAYQLQFSHYMEKLRKTDENGNEVEDDDDDDL